MTEEEFIAKVKGDFRWTPQMRIGTAYHAILERPQKCLDGCYEDADWPGYRFEPRAIENMLDLIPPGLFEVKTTRELVIPGAGPITVVAKCDHITGNQIAEFKTTLSNFDSEKYMASVQWRVMALLFDASRITYHVACLAEEGDRFALKSLESLAVYPYTDMERDVGDLVRELVCWVKAKGLASYLTPKSSAVAV